MRVYGYARISTLKQNIQRQIDNIKKQYPDAVIVSEQFTGTRIDRPAFDRMLKQVKPGDIIVFDEVSRMSRNADEGFELYQRLYNMGVELVFIKEPYINTSVYRDATRRQIDANISTGKDSTDKLTKAILEALNDFQMDLAKEQIKAAFATAQAEVDFLHQRTSEGVRRAQAEGKIIGRPTGAKITTKKSQAAKEIIRKHSKDFGGTLSDADVIKLAGCSRNSYYKYKAELKEA